MKTITMLLDEASNIIKEHEQKRIANGDEFNIFKITGIQSDEDVEFVTICYSLLLMFFYYI